MPGTLAKDDVTSIMDDDYNDIFGLEEWHRKINLFLLR